MSIKFLNNQSITGTLTTTGAATLGGSLTIGDGTTTGKKLILKNGVRINSIFTTDSSSNASLTIKGGNFTHSVSLEDSYGSPKYAMISGGYVNTSYLRLWRYDSDKTTISEFSEYRSNGASIGGDVTVSGDLTVSGNQYFNGEFIEGDGKEMFRYNDSWLRINEDNDFVSGIYCGSGIFRTDGQIHVGPGGNQFKVESNGNTTINGNVGVAGNLSLTGDNRTINIAGGTTSNQSKLIIGEQSAYGVGFRWDAGSSLVFDGFWNSSVTGASNRDLGSIDVDSKIWYLKDTVIVSGTITAAGGNSTQWNAHTSNLGTVTSIATTNGITGGTITGSGTIQVDSTVVRTTGAQSIGDVKTFTSRADFTNGDGLRTNQVRTYGGQQLVLNAGESSSYATGQTAENVYVNAEAGLQINSSPDNWSSGWAGRTTANINAAGGASTLPGTLTIIGDLTIYGTGRIQGIDTVTANTDAANKLYVDNAVAVIVTPATPTTITSTIVGETIEVAFNQSSTSNIDYYQVWSSDDGADYGIVAQIAPDGFSSTMTVVDSSFYTGGTMSYRVYAVKGGVYSSAGTTNKAYTVGALSVTGMSVTNLNTAYYIQYEKPVTRFMDHVEIYMDSQTTQAALTRAAATIVYSGQNHSYMRSVSNSNNFHQFWVEIVTT